MFRTVRVMAMVATALMMGVPATQAAMVVGESMHPTPTSSFQSINRINVNTATVEQLAKVPLISEQSAKAIVAYRDSHGPFTNLSQLQYIKGIFPMDLDTIGQYVLVD